MAALLVLYRLGETVQMVHSKGYIARLVLSQEKGTKWRVYRGRGNSYGRGVNGKWSKANFVKLPCLYLSESLYEVRSDLCNYCAIYQFLVPLGSSCQVQKKGVLAQKR